MKEKSKDYDFIRGFNKITIRSICKDLKVDPANVISNRASNQNISNVKYEIERRYMKLYE